MDHTPHGTVRLQRANTCICCRGSRSALKTEFLIRHTVWCSLGRRSIKAHQIRACYEIPAEHKKKILLQKEGISSNTNAAISRAMRAVSHRKHPKSTPKAPGRIKPESMTTSYWGLWWLRTTGCKPCFFSFTGIATAGHRRQRGGTAQPEWENGKRAALDILAGAAPAIAR